MRQTVVARWEAKGGKQFIELYRNNSEELGTWFSYRGNGCGGTLPKMQWMEDAILWTERNPVLVLRSDYPSLRRTYIHYGATIDT